MNNPEIVISQERMDINLPVYAWDLLPHKEKPFDLNRSPMWHAEYDFKKRTTYTAILFIPNNTQPLRTKHILPKEVLKYRHECYTMYHDLV